MLSVNQVLQGRYRITRQLGHGGMGAVYEAKDTRLGSLVALKQILFDLDEGADLKQQELSRLAFEREAKILANLHHEAFPRVTDYFTEGNRQFLVMVLIEGDDLGELLQKKGAPFLPEDVLSWAEQLLDALDYLHTQNPPILHRDIKPQNLKLTNRGKIALLDFGIAKGVESKTQGVLTSQTLLAATLNYSPIEQIFRVMDTTFRSVIETGHRTKFNEAARQAIDVRSDLYALGATLYHLMTGRLPNDALKRILEVWLENGDVLPYPSVVNPEIPPEISDFLLKSMELESKNRFASAKEMHQALRRAVGDVRQREEDARKAVYWAEQLQLEADRQFAEQKRLEFAEEEKKRNAVLLREAEIQRGLAEERAQNAEKLLKEHESGNLGIQKRRIGQSLALGQVELLEDRAEGLSEASVKPLQESKLQLLTIDSFPPKNSDDSESAEITGFPSASSYSAGAADKFSYFPESIFETGEQETVARIASSILPEKRKRIARLDSKAASFLPVLVVGLLSICGIFAIFILQNFPAVKMTDNFSNSNNSLPTAQKNNSSLLSPPSEATSSSSVAVSGDKTDDSKSNSLPTKATLPSPKTSKTSGTKIKSNKIPRRLSKPRNLDCIFSDNCR